LGSSSVTNQKSSRNTSSSGGMNPDLSAWMADVQRGDEDAYRSLLNALQPMLFRYLRRRVRSDEAAEDISQDVFLTMHRVRHTYEPTRPFEPWFFSIARSRLIDYMRKVKRTSSHEYATDELPELVAPEGPAGWSRFLEILENLPASQREAFMMLKVQGLSTTQAAEQAGISGSALKGRAHRAYGKIKSGFLEDET